MAEPVPDARDVVSGTGRPPVGRRTVAVWLVLLLIAGAAGLVDRQVRRREGAALAACAARIDRQVVLGLAPVTAMAGYVRPALDGAARPELRRGLYRMVSRVASRSELDLGRVRADCADVRVLWPHRRLRARRTACLSRIEDQESYLRAVRRDGAAAFTPLPPDGGC